MTGYSLPRDQIGYWAVKIRIVRKAKGSIGGSHLLMRAALYTADIGNRFSLCRMRLNKQSM